MQKSYRILSLDGGGSWAILQIKTLIELYGKETLGHEVLADFNLIAANSGGSIVAAGLAENYPLSRIYELFRDEAQRKKIFKKVAWWNKLKPIAWLGLSPRYSTKAKREGLGEVLPRIGNLPMDQVLVPGFGGSNVRFVFMTYDYDRDRASFMRSWESLASAVSTRFQPFSFADAVHASTNAPIQYFDRPASTQIDNRRFWDGGLTGYNNPILASVVEALANGAARDEIGVLSLGTSTTFLPTSGLPSEYVKIREQPGIQTDLLKLAKTVLADPPDAASFISHIMLDQPLPLKAGQCVNTTSVVRMNPMITPALQAVDEQGNEIWKAPEGLSDDEFKALIHLDIDAVADEQVDLIERLWTCWQAGGVRNQPVRGGLRGLCEIGYSSYAEGLAAWRAMVGK